MDTALVLSGNSQVGVWCELLLLWCNCGGEMVFEAAGYQIVGKMVGDVEVGRNVQSIMNRMPMQTIQTGKQQISPGARSKERTYLMHQQPLHL